MVKIELHLHTMYACGCGKNDAATIVSQYLNAGYDGIVVTDHYKRSTKWFPRYLPFGEDIHGFLEGYFRVREEGEKRGLRVYRGAEIRFTEWSNDYLLINYPDELLRNPELIFDMGIKQFSALTHQTDALLIQAHPFRSSFKLSCQPADATLLDGVEIYNGAPAHENHNDLAEKFAREHPALIRTQGSDCHHTGDVALAGIGLPFLPTDEKELADMLRARQFELLERRHGIKYADLIKNTTKQSSGNLGGT